VRIGPLSGRIALSANSFADSYIGDDKVRRGEDDLAAAGVVLDGASEIAISGNQFASVRPKAVTVENGARRVAFVGNALVDVTSDQSKLEASVVDDNVLPAVD
jgi:hypothetical protein